MLIDETKVPVTWTGEPVTYRENNKFDKNIILNAIGETKTIIINKSLFSESESSEIFISKSAKGGAVTDSVADCFYYNESLMQKIRGNKITSISLDITTKGKFTVVKGTNVGLASYSREAIKTFDVVIGDNLVLNFDAPVIFGSNDSIGFQLNGDTARFAYKSDATPDYPIGFIYYNGTSWITNNTNSLNILIKGKKLTDNIQVLSAQMKSEYTDLSVYKMAVLGDSIPTYENTIPVGYPAFYPKDDVDSFDKHWLGLLLKNTGMTLEVNNSYSGSTVMWGTESSMNHDVRVLNLGNPDIIINTGGTNDFTGNSSLLGEFSNSGVFDVTKFIPAYQSMIEKELKRYPKATIFISTPIQQAVFDSYPLFPIRKQKTGGQIEFMDQYCDAIRDIAKKYGVHLIDLYQCGITYFNSNTSPTSVGTTKNLYLPDGIHPNAAGMVVYEAAIRQRLKEVMLGR